MPRTRLERTCALIGVIVAALLASLVVATWRGYKPGAQDASPEVVLDDTAEAASLRERPTPTTTSPAPATAVVTVAAVAGDCWLEARVDSSAGRQLYFGMLARGETTRFEARRVWLRLGAAQTVDVRLGGERVDGIGSGVRELLATAEGVAPVPAN